MKPLSVVYFCFFLSACASIPDFPADGDFGEHEVRNIGPGIEIIVGRTNSGSIGWTAVRSAFALAISPPSTLSRHAGDYFEDPTVAAVITGSPHDPIRFRSGLPQDVTGIYRIDGVDYSVSDGRHDAVGVTDNGMPEILKPSEQSDWEGDAIGGFYAVLENGETVNHVPVRDAVSAVGWTEDGNKVILLVIKGREGVGFSYEEAGGLLESLGAHNGIAMDGGDSSRLVWREDGDLYSFPAGRFYRALPNHLLIRIYED